MNEQCSFYICATCFATDEAPRECHGAPMIHCGELKPGDNRLKPLTDASGQLKGRAPRWFLDSLGLERNREE